MSLFSIASWAEKSEQDKRALLAHMSLDIDKCRYIQNTNRTVK